MKGSRVRQGQLASYWLVGGIALMGCMPSQEKGPDEQDTTNSGSSSNSTSTVTTSGTTVPGVSTGPDEPTGPADPTTGSSSGSTQGSTDSGTLDDSTSGSTGDSTGSSGDMAGPCGQVHDGNLYIKEDTDFATLAEIRHVKGNLHVRMEERVQADLSFLPCLHTVDGVLHISDNEYLDSTAGLTDLTSLGALTVYNNPSLRALTGFEQIHTLVYVQFDHNPELEEVHLESLNIVKSILIGYCIGDVGDAGHDLLTDLSGFSGLTNVERVQLDGNEALDYADLFDTLILNGAPQLMQAWVRYNPVLSEDQINLQLNMQGTQWREVCGNEGGVQGCLCPIE